MYSMKTFNNIIGIDTAFCQRLINDVRFWSRVGGRNKGDVTSHVSLSRMMNACGQCLLVVYYKLLNLCFFFNLSLIRNSFLTVGVVH
jgi:hypothetical protein